MILFSRTDRLKTLKYLEWRITLLIYRPAMETHVYKYIVRKCKGVFLKRVLLVFLYVHKLAFCRNKVHTKKCTLKKIKK